MASMVVDTLSIVRDLRAASVSSDQAEAIATAIGRSVSEGAASKSDIRELEVRLDKLEVAIDGKLDRFKVEMMRWFLASTITIVGAVIAAAKLL